MATHVGYMSEPTTTGKVVLTTTLGDLDCELWGKEAPKACRNFIQLCMEGYYNNCQFHRVVKDFMAQTGDPTNTGQGGESVYGEPFKDEFNSRLRFNRRGLIGMATTEPNSNRSQFFFTLGPCEWLQKKNTLFGKVTGNTLFNLLKLQDLETENDRPLYTQKILKAEIVLNPFTDIVPRPPKKQEELSEADLKPKQKETKKLNLISFADDAEDDDDGAEKKKKKKDKSKGKEKEKSDDRKKSKNMHDYEDEDEDEGDEEEKNKKKPKPKSKSIHDLIDDDDRLERSEENEAEVLALKMAARAALSKRKKEKAAEEEAASALVGSNEARRSNMDAKMRARILSAKYALDSKGKTAPEGVDGKEEKQKPQEEEEQDPLEEMKNKPLKREYARLRDKVLGYRQDKASQSMAFKRDDGRRPDDLLTPLEQKRQLYKARTKRTREREGETLAKLDSFRSTLASLPPPEPKKDNKKEDKDQVGKTPEDLDVDEAKRLQMLEEEAEKEAERDLETGAWIAHSIKFKKRPQDFDEMARGAEAYEYEVFDPRNVRGLKHNLPSKPTGGGGGGGGGPGGPRTGPGTRPPPSK